MKKIKILITVTILIFLIACNETYDNNYPEEKEGEIVVIESGIVISDEAYEELTNLELPPLIAQSSWNQVSLLDLATGEIIVSHDFERIDESESENRWIDRVWDLGEGRATMIRVYTHSFSLFIHK